MDKLKDLRAGVAEMRSVAQKLLNWAAELEKSVQEHAEGEPEEGKPEEDSGAVNSGETPAPEAPVANPALARSLARAVMECLCAAGYSAQVKALIATFGAAALSAVPDETIGALMKAAMRLGGDLVAG